MWHFEERGQSVGPIQEAQIRQAIATGRVTQATLVWRDGMAGWVAAGQTELAGAFAAGAGVPPSLPGGVPGSNAPGFGAAGYGTPAFGPAGSNAPGLGSPGYSTPGFGAPGFAAGHAPGQAGPGVMRLAGFWVRLVAYIVDAILLQIGIYLISYAVGMGLAQTVLMSDTSMDFTVVQAVVAIAGIVFSIVYSVSFMASRWQATPGKRLLGLRVVRVDGQRIGVLLALGRNLAYFVSAIILCIGFFMIGWTREKTGLHDLMCGTRVVHGRA